MRSQPAKLAKFFRGFAFIVPVFSLILRAWIVIALTVHQGNQILHSARPTHCPDFGLAIAKS